MPASPTSRSVHSAILLALSLTLLTLSACTTRLPVHDPDVIAFVLKEPITRADMERVLASELGERMRTGAPSPEAYAQWAAREPIRELRARIWRPLLDRYTANHRLHASEEEILQYQKMHSTPRDHHGVDPNHAKEIIQLWKLEHALYAEYGGRVYRVHPHRVEPVDAYWAYYRACEKEGLFTFFDEDLRIRFYDDSDMVDAYKGQVPDDEAARILNQPVWEPSPPAMPAEE